MSFLMQVWGGSFYLLQKILLSRAERLPREQARSWRINAWMIYIAGLPPWLIIFAQENNWIAAAVELGGLPSMILGLVIATRGTGNVPSWLDMTAGITATVVGLTYSAYVLGGIHTFTQVLEIALAIGFLVGTYQLAKQRSSGYLWYVLMNGANAWLMLLEHYPWLFLQQLISIVFVLDAYRIQKARQRAELSVDS